MNMRVALCLALSIHLATIARGQKDLKLVLRPTPVADIALPVFKRCIKFYSSSSAITSPNFPRNYNNNADCYFHVTDNSGARIQLVFNNFDLETNYDVLYISSDGIFIGRYTGSSIPPVLTLNSTITLHFTSDVSIVKQGFSITATALDSTCGGLVVGSGLISSPGFPVAYSDNIRCVWGVVATLGETITLDFLSFNLESNYDWLELYDGNTLVARYTGTLVPPRANLGAAGRVVFTTDSSVTYPGFSIMANSAALHCGGLITSYTVISSPNYPNNYGMNAVCTWTYQFPAVATSVSLTFVAFNLENNYDFVKIYNGQTLIRTLTGTALPSPVVITSGVVTIVFTSDNNIELSGFQLLFNPVTPPSVPH